MIYLFDRAKKLQKIIPRKHIINATQTKVRNGIYQLAVEVPLFYETKQGTQYNYQKSVSKATFAGHYDDKNRFQLYKIYSRNITANEQGEFLLFDGVHIFFDEAKAMGNIHDRRFRDSEAKAPADAAFNSIGWTVIDYDVTERHDINFYRASVTDAWNDLISTYGVEFDYELQFDGRKIISKNIIMKKQIGQWTGQRFAYGTNVLTLTQEQDESEVYTAAVGRGRGEESGDGFGPRLEFGDIAWSKDGITKPVGQNYIELPSATAEYGFIENGVVKPRIAPEVVFENIEDKIKLADATYYWLLENCLPKATWKTDVARIGNLNLGDAVGVLYKAAGIIKRARVEKIEYNLLDPELSKLTLGDFHHFENRQMKRINAQIKRLDRDTSDRITRIKNEWNAWIDNQFTAALNQFEQNLIDQQAEIEADREKMTNLIEGTRAEFTDNINAEITQTKEYAEEQAQAKASAVQTNLDSFKDSHQQLYDEVTGNVLDIDTFLGDKSKTLKQQFDTVRTDFDTLQTDLDGVESDLTATKTDLQKQLDAARADLDGLEVGGRNLLYNSDFSNGKEHWQGTFEINSSGKPFGNGESANISQLYAKDKNNILLEPDTEYIYAMRVKLSETVAQTSSPVHYHYFDGTSSNAALTHYLVDSSGKRVGSSTPIVANKWVTIYRYAKTKPVFDTEKPVFRPYLYGLKENVQYEVDWLYFIKGNKPFVDWVDNPEDTEQKITTLNQHIENIDGQLSTKLEQTDIEPINNKITEYGNNLTANAQSIESLISKSELHDGDITKWSNLTTETAKGLERTIGRVSTAEGKLSNAELAIEANADGLALRATKTEVEQAIDGIEVGGRNLVPNSNEFSRLIRHDSRFIVFKEGQKVEEWNTEEATYFEAETTKGNSTILTSNVYGTSGMVGVWSIYVKNVGDSNISARTNGFSSPVSSTNIAPGEAVRIVIPGKARTAYDFIQLYFANTGTLKAYFYGEQLEFGNKVTAYSPAPEDTDAKITKVSSDLEIEAGRIEGLVTDISKDYVKQSSVKVTSDRVTIGSTVVNGSTIGSVLSVSPTGIDAVAKAMRLSGDLYVDGDITSLAVNAIEGNFSRLFTSSLTTNVIKSNHIQTDTALAKKLFATNANIDELVTRTHFSNSIKTLSIDAVHADLRSVNSEIMSTNILKSDWIDVDNAIVNRIISRQFFTDNAVIKAANIRDLTATDIKGGVLSSLNNSMQFNLMSNHLEFNNDATIDFYSKKNAFRMFTDSSTSDPRDIIHALGTSTSRTGYGQMFLGGGHYDIDGTVKANDVGFAGLKLGGNSATLAGSKVLIGSGGDDGKDQFFEFDFTTSLSNRYAYFRPTNTSDNFVIGSSDRWFHSMYTWRLNGLRFYNPSGHIKMGYDNGSGTGASLRFYEDDIWFDRGGTFSLKRTITRANDNHNSINASNGILAQLKNLAYRVSVLENK